MIKTFLISMFAIFLFALGAAGSWLYLNMAELSGDTDAASETVSGDTTTNTNTISTGLGMGGAVTPIPQPVDNPMGTPVHTKAISDEEVFRYSAMYRERDDELKQREERLQKDEMRLKLVQKDIEASMRMFEGIREEVNSTLASEEQLLNELNQASQRLTEEKADVEKRSELLKQSEKETNADEEAAIKKGATRIQSMPPDKAAGTLVELINDGRIEYVRRLVDRMEERKAAAVLGAMDTVLVAELLDPTMEDAVFDERR